MLRMSVLVLLGLFALPTAALAGDIGVILMHGKWGTAKTKSPVGKLAGKLEAAGITVVTPDMPWHADRYLEKGYEESFAEIDAAVQRLRDRGASKIIVGGHSMGANAAIGYGASRDGLAGVLAMAPGHVPDIQVDDFADSVALARRMIADGKGGDSGDFHDINQGKRKSISASAEDYLSWFDPQGGAAMPLSVAKLKAPLYWIIGEDDRMNERGPEYAYNAAASHAKNEYVVVAGGHKATPIKGAKEIIKWLKGL